LPFSVAMLNYQRVTWVCIIMFRIYLFYRVINWGYLILGWDFSTYVHINGCVLHKHEDPNLNNTVQNTYTVIWHAYCVYIYIHYHLIQLIIEFPFYPTIGFNLPYIYIYTCLGISSWFFRVKWNSLGISSWWKDYI
jgi:hypothetical protein